MKHSASLLVATLFGSLMGCATTTPAPSELVNARAAYDHASNGPAARLALVDLHNARGDLDRAEQSFLTEPASDQTRDLSYIAERRAEIATARGEELSAREERQHADQAGVQLQGQQLQAARSTVRTQQQQLDSTQQQLQNTNQQVAAGQQQLAASEQARQNAERETRAAMASLRQASAVREDQRGMIITLSGEVLFVSGEAVLLPIAQQRLDQVALALQDQATHRLTVEGHTDSRGSSAANQSLSQARADAVRAYLVTRGINAQQIDAVGLGASRPVAANTSAEGRAENRRVEIVVGPAGTAHTVAAAAQ